MTAYLLEREKDELLKPETRTLNFPDESKHTITMNNIYWRWYDRIAGYMFGDNCKKFLEKALYISGREDNIQDGWTLESVLEHMIDREIRGADDRGVDFTETDVDLQIMVGKQRIMKFHKRNSKNKKNE